MSLAAWVGVLVAVGVIAFFFAYYTRWLALTKRRTGSYGIVQRSRLTCPRCHGTFDFEWVPGAALSAVRLGSRRYMACPLCHRWSAFDLRAGLEPLLGSPPQAARR